eukprot:Em0018g516a
MTQLWTAQGIKIEELDAYLLCCNDELNLEIKCREFVRLVSSVILTPVATNHSAIILMKFEQRKAVNGGVQTTLAQKLKEHGFEVGNKIEATYEMLTNCYNFTVIARLSPKWNPVGPWLVQASVPSTPLSCAALCDHTSSGVQSLQSQKNGPDENTQHAMLVNTFNPAVTCDT